MGFSTAPLIATGCIMMRACHLNTCPVGIATQDPELRKRFKGTPEHVVNFFFLVAEEARQIMASLGVRSIDELIGRTELLRADEAIEHWKARGVDLTHVLAQPPLPDDAPRRRVRGPEPVLDDHLDWLLIEQAGPALERGEPVEIETRVRNVHRCVGGILSSHIAAAHGADGPARGHDQGHVARLGRAVLRRLAGRRRLVHPARRRQRLHGQGPVGRHAGRAPARRRRLRSAEDNVIIGNTVLYGATSGRAFFRGMAGERFAVRNSGASAVIEGVGDHGCEYMTGGRVVVLGRTGRNFAAGMSGGLAYVLDEHRTFRGRVNNAMLDQLEELDEADAIELRTLVAEHLERTGSPVARRVLDGWEELLPRFVKIFPTDYKRVLAELAAQEAAARMPGAVAEARPPSPWDGRPPRADEFEDEAVDVVGSPHVRELDGE